MSRIDGGPTPKKNPASDLFADEGDGEIDSKCRAGLTEPVCGDTPIDTTTRPGELRMKSFSALLDALIAATPERRATVEQLVQDAFRARKAVLALDMSGFTLSVRRDGILSYLCQIRRMQKLTLPIVHAHRGELVKFDADNLLAVFDEPDRAVEAAVAMNRAAAASVQGLAFSIGIDFGELLLIAGADCFGDPVNLAYKLGEDIAKPGEILITGKTREALGDVPRREIREMPLSICGVELLAYSVLYERD